MGESLAALTAFVSLSLVRLLAFRKRATDDIGGVEPLLDQTRAKSVVNEIEF
jgi:hypothetical protein